MSTIVDGSSGLTFPNGTVQAAAASSAMTLISTQTFSNVSSVSWIGLSGYNNYLLVYNNISAASTGGYLNLQFGEGSTPTYVTSGYISQYMAYGNGSFSSAQTLSDSKITISGPDNGLGNSPGASGFVYIYSMNNGKITSLSGTSICFNQSGTGNYETDTVGGVLTSDTTVKTAILLKCSFGGTNYNITGTASLYGILS